MNKKPLIIYVDDDDTVRNINAEIIELNNSYIKFKTDKENTITIPIHRLIKIKEKDE